MTPHEQLEAIRERVVELQRAGRRALSDELRPALAKERHPDRGLGGADERGSGDASDVAFRERIFPVLTPLSVDPAHPFPYISTSR